MKQEQKKQGLGPLQEKWVRALESGMYRQAKGKLQRGYGFCCLGIANLVCELYEPTENELQVTYTKIGLRTPTGDLGENFQIYGKYCLAAANDLGASFHEIASFIRAHPKAVFTEEK